MLYEHILGLHVEEWDYMVAHKFVYETGKLLEVDFLEKEIYIPAT